MALTTIDDRGLKTPIDLLDNEKIRFGTGNDLEIYHNGSNSIIADNGTGELSLQTNGTGIRVWDATNSETHLKTTGNGNVELYYDGTKKFETTVDGTLISGTKLEIKAEGASNEPQLKITSENGGIFLRTAGSSGSFPTGGGGDDGELLYLGGDFRLGLGGASKNLIFINGSGYTERARINSSGSFKLPDSAKIELGGAQTGSGDLQIYHDGTDSHIDNSTGNIRLRINGTENAIVAKPDAEVQLYYNGSKKAYTQTTGMVFTNNNAPNLALDSTPVKLVLDNDSTHDWDHDEHCGAIIFKKGGNIVSGITGTHTRTGSGHSNEDGGIQIWTSPSAQPTVPEQVWEFDSLGSFVGKDNHKILLGDSNDLQIYHNGTDSFIKNINGDLKLFVGTEQALIAKPNGAVELYYDDAKKLETSPGGIRLNGVENAGSQLQIGASQDFQIEHDGSNTYLGNSTGDLVLQNDANVKITAKTGGTQRFRFDSDGLKFGTDTAAANALDDYEEGTWTPTYGGGSSDPTVSYEDQVGQYVRIGRIVTAFFRLRTDTVSGGSGNLKVRGLPFTASSYHGMYGGYVTYTGAWKADSAPTLIHIGASNDEATIYKREDGNEDPSVMQISDLNNGANKNDLRATLIYYSQA